MSLVDRVVAKWQASGQQVYAGCSRGEIATFERRVGMRLPPELKKLLLRANGIAEDENLFSFWSLSDYDSFRSQHRAHTPTSPSIALPDDYYVFCDYMHWSWAYAVRLQRAGEKGYLSEVLPIGRLDVEPIAVSFAEFLQLYLDDAPRLYQGSSARPG